MKLWNVLIPLLGQCVLLQAQLARVDQRLSEGSDVTVPCENEGHVFWSKLAEGKREIILTAQRKQTPVKLKADPDHRYKVLPDLSLLIKKVVGSDSGIYYCNATPVMELQVTRLKEIPTDDNIESTTGGVNGVMREQLVCLFALFLFILSFQ